MNEDYVSYEVAKLLKENGFDWYCRALYAPNSEVLSHSLGVSNTYDVDVYAAPTLHMAQKWLRVEYSGMKLRKRKKQIDRIWFRKRYRTEVPDGHQSYRQWMLRHFKTLDYQKYFHKHFYR